MTREFHYSEDELFLFEAGKIYEFVQSGRNIGSMLCSSCNFYDKENFLCHHPNVEEQDKRCCMRHRKDGCEGNWIESSFKSKKIKTSDRSDEEIRICDMILG